MDGDDVDWPPAHEYLRSVHDSSILVYIVVRPREDSLVIREKCIKCVTVEMKFLYPFQVYTADRDPGPPSNDHTVEMKKKSTNILPIFIACNEGYISPGGTSKFLICIEPLYTTICNKIALRNYMLCSWACELSVRS